MTVRKCISATKRNQAVTHSNHIHMTNADTLVWTETLTTVKTFLPGHNRVSSFKEPTVSRDDSMVVALPSNILPEK